MQVAEHSTYGLAEPEVVAPVLPAPAVAPETGPTFQPSTAAGEDLIPAQEFPGTFPAVEEVWTRWAEWKEPLLWIAACIGLVVLIEIGHGWTTALILFLALAYGTYYLAITLEIPVRLTAENAVREFYLALGHRLPNYRRAYLFLTSEGKTSDQFSNFNEFTAYWKGFMSKLGTSPVWLVPLEFRVEGCKCRYNSEKSFALLRYRVQVFPRGRQRDTPLAEFDVQNSAVKGPDGHWYLNCGRLLEKPEG